MGVVIDFNKAKARLKKKAVLFKSVQEEKPKKRRKIEVTVRKKKSIDLSTENPWADPRFEDVRIRGKLVTRLKKEYCH